jgi:hypothetical protein
MGIKLPHENVVEHRQGIDQTKILRNQRGSATDLLMNQADKSGFARNTAAYKAYAVSIFYTQGERANHPLSSERGRKAG